MEEREKAERDNVPVQRGITEIKQRNEKQKTGD